MRRRDRMWTAAVPVVLVPLLAESASGAPEAPWMAEASMAGSRPAGDLNTVSATGICTRTAQVQTAIIAAVSGKTTCGAITDADLAGITGTLALDDQSINVLKAGDFDGLTNLNELKLHRNRLSSLPADIFDELTSLSRLNLYRNRLSSLPAGVFDELTSLTVLNLGRNLLNRLPAGAFGNLTSLQALGLHANIHLDASSLASAFDELTSLVSLRLDYSRISSLPAGIFDELTALTELRISGNHLTGLPSGVFDKLPDLTFLDLHGNRFTDLRAGVFDKLTKLTTLNLFRNRLTGLSSGVFDKLIKLRALTLNGNQLSTLPEDVFEKQSSLILLWLHNNNLRTLPSETFAKLKLLSNLNLSGNSDLACLPVLPRKVTSLSLDKQASAYAACDAGLTVTPTNLTVMPNGTATYTVVLDAAPNRYANGGSVTVTPASSATSVATVSDTMIFTTANWSTARTVTVTGVAQGAATISHTASGGGYDGASASSVGVAVGMAMVVDSITSSTAKLILGGHMGDWYYKQSAPSGGMCSSSPVTGTTASLTDLSSNTNYTFKAYSDNTCSQELATAGTFVTRPGMSTKPTAASGVNGGEVAIAASVTGTGALIKWQYVKKSGAGGFEPTWTDISATSTTLTHTVTGLTAGMDYQFKVRAVNASGAGAASDASDAAQPPAATLRVSAATRTTATLTLANWTDAWWHDKTAGPGTANCTRVESGTNTASLSGLTAGSNYTWTAYSARGCVSLDKIADVDFTTSRPTSLAVSNVTHNSATLSISGHTAAWWHQGSQAEASCVPVPENTTTAKLEGLSAGTSYTYTAYDAANCGSGDVLATAPSFTTKVGYLQIVAIADQTWIRDEAIPTLTLPAATASAGGPAVAYTLSPAPPSGLSFDATNRAISGTPTAILPSTTYTYTATAPDYTAASRTFNIEVLLEALDLLPSFGVAFIADQVHTQNAPIKPVTLPEATGGDGELTYALSPELPAGLTFDPVTRVLSGTPTEAAEATTYAYTATDADPVDADVATLLFDMTVLPDFAPDFGDASIADRYYQETIPIEATTLPEATGGDGELTYALSPDLPAGLTFDPATRELSGTPTEAAETATYTYTATDSDAVDPDVAALTFEITVEPDLPPSFGGAFVAHQTYQETIPLEPLALPAATGGNGELTYALSPDLPPGLTFDPATRELSGTPTEPTETATYTYTATDADLVDPDVATLTFEITVEPDLPPSFGGASIADQTYQENIPLEPLALPAATGGNGELTYALSPDLPAGLVFDAATRELSGTPTEVAETATYTYTATDADLVDPDVAALTFEMTVLPDLVPSFGDASIENRSHKENIPIERTTLPEATGGDGELTYALSPDLPAGLVFDAATRELSGTPTEAAETATYTYTATDADVVDPDVAALTFEMTVLPDLVPSFGDASIASRSYQETIPIDAATLPEATGGDGELTYALSPELPAGLTFDAATRKLSGTPTEPTETATYTYTATDADVVDPDAATLTFDITVEPDLAPDFGGASIADQVRIRHVPVAPFTLPTANGGDGELTYALSPELPAGLTFDPATRVLSGTPTELAGAQMYQYTVTDSDPVEPDAATLTFTIEVTYSSAHKAVLNDALAAQGRALLTGATSVIGERFRAPAASPLPGGATGLGLADGYGPDAASFVTLGGVRGPSLDQLIGDRSFAVSLRGASGASQGDAPRSRWTLWGAADAQRFDGASKAGQLDGGVASLYLGADVRLGGGLMVGAALSRSAGEADYHVDSGAGRLETDLTGVHPYLRGETGWGLELWAIGGTGAGRADDLSKHAGSAVETADLAMRMAAAGLRQPLIHLGAVRFSVVGAVGTVSLTTGEGDGPRRAVDGLDAVVTQGRLALEIAPEFGALSSYVRLGARSDGGDGLTGRGAEVVGGLRYSGGRVDFEATARWLAAHSEEAYREYGGMARLVFKSRADGSGLRMRLSPRTGDIAGTLPGVGEGLLGGSNVGAMFPTSGPELRESAPLSLAGELGYGLLLGRSLLTLGATHDRDVRGGRETFGLTWEPRESRVGGGLSFRLGYERSTATEHGGPRLDLAYSARF